MFVSQKHISHITYQLTNFYKKHIDATLLLVPGKQKVEHKIIRWQNERTRWAHYVRNKVNSRLNIEVSAYAEHNHSSLKAIAGDNACRPIEKNIVDVMERTKLLFEKRQNLKYKYSVHVDAELRKMNVT